MGQTELSIFVILATIIIVFVVYYYKRKLVYEQDKNNLTKQHQQDILNTKLEIQVQTMADIGREVHDSVVQHLAHASILANQIAEEKNYPTIHTETTTIAEILNGSIEEIRRLSKSLTNPDAEIKSLTELVAYECKRIEAIKVCTVDYSTNEETLILSSMIKNFILRIIQEFMQNSLKHSSCKKIKIMLDFSPKGLTIGAMDDGQGFDINEYLANNNTGIGIEIGIGIANIKKRVELLGGEVTLKSEINKGTFLNLHIPASNLGILKE